MKDIFARFIRRFGLRSFQAGEFFTDYCIRSNRDNLNDCFDTPEISVSGWKVTQTGTSEERIYPIDILNILKGVFQLIDSFDSSSTASDSWMGPGWAPDCSVPFLVGFMDTNSFESRNEGF